MKVGDAPASHEAASRAAAIQVELDGLTARRAELTEELAALEGVEQGQRSPSAEPRPGSVLVVNSDEGVLLAAMGPLRAAGYDVSTAANGAQALTRLTEAPPDLIVADAALPDLTGFELVAAIRRNPEWEHVPLIFLTTPATVRDLELGLGLGPDHYVVSPQDPSALVARVASALARPGPPSSVAGDVRRGGPASRKAFDRACAREIVRSAANAPGAALALLTIYELNVVRTRLGPQADRELGRELERVITRYLGLLDAVARQPDGTFAVLLADSAAAEDRIGRIVRAIVNRPFLAGGTELFVTPAVGYVPLRETPSVAVARRRAYVAATAAAMQNDLRPLAYVPEMEPVAAPRAGIRDRGWSGTRRLLRRLNLALQIGLTFLVGVGLPFALYVALDQAGFNVTLVMYPVIVLTLVIAGSLIWVEGLAALRPTEPPPFDGTYPPASAIIAAYLPNEAATILETVAAFRRLDYPGDLQMILAYNTPRSLPVEAVLRSIAARDPRLELLRVEGSNSKAQNVNAALDGVRGDFVGLFDADHHPDPLSFRRAWAWLAGGSDVVQGHNVVRGGDVSALGRLVAVEFESTYAVGHPGRNRLHGFGLFGGSNGYWRTELLRETRMRGFMLTEDIDSSMRVVFAGHRIASDRSLISKELAPTTVRALWAQRTRWAQGWFQVSLHHTLPLLRSRDLTFPQKLGVVHLLVWRELYPWLSLQMFPIVAFWLLAAPRPLDWFVPLFVVTTLFTLSVGPGQALFAFRLGDPSIRRHWTWFLWYLIAGVAYTEFKNMITRVAQVKEAMRERDWRVTPRPGRPQVPAKATSGT